jgi:hypothetical protein
MPHRPTHDDAPMMLTDDTGFEDAWAYALDQGRVLASSRGMFEDLHLMNPDMATRTLVDLPSVGRVAAASAGVAKPAGEVDEYGRVRLPEGADPDALLADPLALARAWRQILEFDDEQRRGGGTLSGYPHDGRDAFERDWRIFVDCRRDLVATIKLRAWEAAQDRAARRRSERDRIEGEKASRKAAEARALRELDEDRAAYAAMVADAERRNASSSHVTVLPPTFDAFQQRRRSERAASSR